MAAGNGAIADGLLSAAPDHPHKQKDYLPLTKQALVFANGEPNDGPMVRRVFATANHALIVAADGGARVAAYFGYHADVVIGDMDSLLPHEVAHLQANGTQVQRHPRDKDATDLELCLQWAAEQHIDWIRIIGGVGGRFDMVIANVYLLALPALQHCDVALVAGQQSMTLLRPGTHSISGNVGDTLSLIPIGGPVHGITTRNLKYPLQGETLYFGPARGVSNRMLAATAEVTLRDGQLLCVHTVGQVD